MLIPSRRICSLESHVADIRITQAANQSPFLDGHCCGAAPFTCRSPSASPQDPYNQSPPEVIIHLYQLVHIANLSDATIPDSFEVEDNGNGNLDLVAPWEALRGLSDVAIEREGCQGKYRYSSPSVLYADSAGNVWSMSGEAYSDHKRNKRPAKRNSSQDARFYARCSTFLPVFNSRIDTFDLTAQCLHHRMESSHDLFSGTRAIPKAGVWMLRTYHAQLSSPVLCE